MSALDSPMQGDGRSAEPMSEEHRGALRAGCAEDRGIWRLFPLDTVLFAILMDEWPV